MIKIKVEQSVAISLPAAEVFAYISDLENLVDWSSTIIAVRKTSRGPIRVGTTVRATMRFLGRWSDLAFEIVEYDPARSLTIKSIAGISPCLFCYQFEAGKNGGMVLSQEAVIQVVEGIVEMEEAMVMSAVRRQLEYDLVTLRDLLQTRAGESQASEMWQNG